MCATKMVTMRTPTEEHFHKSGELDDPRERSPRNSRAFHSYQTEHHLLSRQTHTHVRNPSLPTLLNVDSSHSSAAETSPLTQEPMQDPSGHHLITPPSSSTRVQFKTPIWKSGSSEHSEFELSSAFRHDSTSSTRRQSSIESLMRAAATVESDTDLNKTYQDKVATILELKNEISNTIRNWPIAKDTSSQELYSAQKSSDSGTGGSSDKILLDQISCENLASLNEVTQRLNNAVKELVYLKEHVRYLKESAAAISRARPVSDSGKRVTLPPIEALTMNLPKKASSKNFQFKNEAAKTSVVPPALEQQKRSSSFHDPRKSHERLSASRISGSATWPPSYIGANHRPTLSDPSAYRNMGKADGSAQEMQYSKPITVPVPPGTRPIILNAQSSLQTSVKMKNKIVKKRKKSSSEKSSPDYHRSLTHGLLLSEPIRKDEQSTTSCVHCGENSTPEWRRGPYGNRTLCNACGLFYRKLIKKFGVKDANLLMRFKKQVNPEDRRVPSVLNVPAAFISNLDNDSTLDAEYNTIGSISGPSSSGA
ncbi:hypothetical protein HG536_0A03260 [Torulaspora globosa]|uniref:GATA-type domain-containing protein n=1 Tax=Torulaspora globosa TaxID=48254 RepID=A0A7G3ZAH2_9SACH|nr:uncharacterized protein HG536_0A03260 [Torulaspora globosa]QLL30508.1 hypothetical protein HG536_0A03260 [Torulaspora globosa]